MISLSTLQSSSGLRRKAVLALLAMSLLPLLATGYWTSRLVEKGVEVSVLELHIGAAARLAAEVQSYTTEMSARLDGALGRLRAPGLGEADLKALLRGLAASHPDIRSAALLDGKGKVLSHAEAGPPMPWAPSLDLDMCRALRRAVCWAPAEGRSPVRLEIARPLPGGRTARLVAVPISLWAAVDTARIGSNGHAVVINQMGRPVLIPTGEFSESARRGIEDWKIVRQALSAGAIGSSWFADHKGLLHVGAYAPVPAFSGAVITQQPMVEAFGVAGKVRRSIVLSVLLMGVIAVGAAFLLSKRLASPLLALADSAERVAAGEFPPPLRLETRDELQTLAETFNRMVEQLKRYSEVQIEKTLQTQQRMEAMLYSIDDGILMTDEASLLLANRSAREMLGLPSVDSLEGRRLEDLALPEPVRRALMAAVADPAAPAVEITLAGAKTPRTIRVASRPVLLPKGQRKLGVVLALSDVTLEREITRLKDDFLHSVSHDLRSPVTAIMGFMDYMLKGVGGKLSDDQADMVTQVKMSASHVLTMVNDILDLARIEFKKVKVNPKFFSLSLLADLTVRSLAPLAKEKGVAFKIDAAGSQIVEADQGLIERLIANFVGNAVKFAKSTVTVAVRDAGDCVELCVGDDGDGIPAAYQDKIFEKFEQVPGTRKGGMGLGLTICKQIVDMHGGRIWVDSAEGKGARFHFSLPKKFTAA
ncbi:MAG: HAMP domain-containing protein [Elusimicrobia bacterium]|nr:HAMP domain-containing protein [Elusimicrobiota bacterium]